MRLVICLLMIAFISQPAFAQVNLGVSNSIIDALDRGARQKNEQERIQAQRELQREQAELLKAQKDALRQQTNSKPFYTDQELQEALSELTRHHPDWQQYQTRMGASALSPSKGLSAYDYVLALYLLAKEKTVEEQRAEAWTKLIMEFSKQHPDLERYAPAMLKIADIFPQKDSESEEAYIGRLYDLAKQAKR